jgi:hypothetical protein
MSLLPEVRAAPELSLGFLHERRFVVDSGLFPIVAVHFRPSASFIAEERRNRLITLPTVGDAL